ncbi:MAG: ABC transporter substrate-binding protein [Suipraeoptans sp.]
MKLKKGLCLFCSAVLLMTTVVGCGKGTDSSSGNTNTNDVTLRMSWWGNDDRHQATLEALKKFEEANPGVTVKAEYSGWDGIIEKMATQIAGGTEADLMQINYDWYQTYSPEGDGFADLNNYKDIIDLSGYDDATLEAANINGKLNGIPHGENASVFAINKTKYEAFGIDPSTLKTWEDYKNIADKFDEGSYPMILTHFNDISTYLAQKYGDGFLDVEGNLNYTAEQIAEGFLWYQDLVDAKVTPSYTRIVETVGTAHKSTVKEFIEGQYAGFFDWTGGLGSFQSVLKENNMELAIQEYPTIEAGGFAGIIKKPTMLFSISKNSKHPEEAAKLLNILLNDPEGVKAMGVSRGVPANKNAAKILEEAGLIDEVSNAADQFGKNTAGITMSPYYQMSQVEEAYMAPFEAYGLGQLSAEEAAEQIVKNVEDAIKQIKEQ